MSGYRSSHRTNTLVRSALGAAVAATAALLEVAEAEARGRIPVLLQITRNSGGIVDWPRVRSQDGSRIVFVSDGDVMGPGTATPVTQVYLWDATAGTTTQITNDPVYPSYDAARSTDDVFAAGRPEVVAFISEADLDPSVGNSDHNPEVFLWELETGAFHQLTDTLPPVVNRNVYPSDSGKCIVFDSNGDLNQNDGVRDPGNPGEGPDKPPLSNADGSREVFLYSLDTRQNYPRDGYFTQVSDGPSGTTSSRPVIGGYWFPRQCQSTVYMSDHDQVGGSRTGTHLYVFSRPPGTRAAMDAPETPGGQPAGNYRNPHISSASPFARGPFVVFSTDADLWNNASSGENLFRYRIFHPRQTQYTRDIAGPVRNPVISDGGGLIAFESSGEPFHPHSHSRTGESPPYNEDGNSEIFFQKGRSQLTQITRTEGCENEQPSLRDDGTMIAFRSSCDLVPGGNPGGVQQVYYYVQVDGDSPLACERPDRYGCECRIEDGCCNEANGCFALVGGRAMKPNKKNCQTRNSCPVE
jgi:Tol biopolymer transport system component